MAIVCGPGNSDILSSRPIPRSFCRRACPIFQFRNTVRIKQNSVSCRTWGKDRLLSPPPYCFPCLHPASLDTHRVARALEHARELAHTASADGVEFMSLL